MAGFAVFGFVNGQAGVSELAYGTSVGATVNYLQERFVAVDMSFPTSGCGVANSCVTIWIFNTGGINLNLLQIRLYGGSPLSVNLLYNYSTIAGVKTDRIHDLLSTNSQHCGITASSYESPTITSFSAKTTNVQTIQLTIPPSNASPSGQTCPSFGQIFTAGTTYTLAISGANGYSLTYSQLR